MNRMFSGQGHEQLPLIPLVMFNYGTKSETDSISERGNGTLSGLVRHNTNPESGPLELETKSVRAEGPVKLKSVVSPTSQTSETWLIGPCRKGGGGTTMMRYRSQVMCGGECQENFRTWLVWSKATVKSKLGKGWMEIWLTPLARFPAPLTGP